MNWIQIVQEAIDEIDENLGKDISVECLAEKFHVSKYYFQKMFSALCDISVSEYIRNRRLSEAAYELKNTNEAILDIVA